MLSLCSCHTLSEVFALLMVKSNAETHIIAVNRLGGPPAVLVGLLEERADV